MKGYRKLALFLSAALIVMMFTSCKMKSEEITLSRNPNGTAYQPEYISLPEEIKDIQSPVIYEGVFILPAKK